VDTKWISDRRHEYVSWKNEWIGLKSFQISVVQHSWIRQIHNRYLIDEAIAHVDSSQIFIPCRNELVEQAIEY
jgi:hypothetical protein